MDVYLITPLDKNGWLFAGSAESLELDFLELKNGAGVLIATEMSEADFYQKFDHYTRSCGSAFITQLPAKYGNTNKAIKEWLSTRLTPASCTAD